MNHTDRLAILIPVFNDAEGLRASLDSLHAAERPAGILTIIVDDGSASPVSVDLRDQSLGALVLRLPKNVGIERALNAGLVAAREYGATIIARLDAGDTVTVDRLTRQLAVLAENPEIGLVGSSARFVDSAGRLVFVFEAAPDDASIRRRMHLNSCILHPTAMWRDAVLATVGDYSTDFPAAEDYELFFRMLGHCQAACVPDALVTTALNDGGISVRRRRAQLASRLRIQRSNFDCRRIESYLGLTATLILFAVPLRLLVALKKVLRRSHY